MTINSKIRDTKKVAADPKWKEVFRLGKQIKELESKKDNITEEIIGTSSLSRSDHERINSLHLLIDEMELNGHYSTGINFNGVYHFLKNANKDEIEWIANLGEYTDRDLAKTFRISTYILKQTLEDVPMFLILTDIVDKYELRPSLKIDGDKDGNKLVDFNYLILKKGTRKVPVIKTRFIQKKDKKDSLGDPVLIIEYNPKIFNDKEKIDSLKKPFKQLEEQVNIYYKEKFEYSIHLNPPINLEFKPLQS